MASFDFDKLLRQAKGEPDPEPAPPKPPKVHKRRPLELVSLSEVAAMAGCSRQNVSQMARAAERGRSRSGFPKPHSRPGGVPVFDKRQIDDWIEAREEVKP